MPPAATANKQRAGYEISCLPKPNRNTYDKICHQQIKQTLQNYHYIGSTSSKTTVNPDTCKYLRSCSYLWWIFKHFTQWKCIISPCASHSEEVSLIISRKKTPNILHSLLILNMPAGKLPPYQFPVVYYHQKTFTKPNLSCFSTLSQLLTAQLLFSECHRV